MSTHPLNTAAKVFLVLSVLVTSRLSSQAEVAVTVEHDDGVLVAEAFHFQLVPSPRPSAALGAVFKVADGTPDDNSAPVDVLHDGKLPDKEDQPASNFFFQKGTDGGRVLVDLGKLVLIKEVHTYSWHPGTRAPQVYKLYGSDGTGAGFVAEPKRPQDPGQGGWKLLATVDTRTRFGNNGGQYGVKVADTTASLGSYRYLLFDVSQTESDDAFGNTFYSEINVVGAGWMGAVVMPVSRVLRTQLSLAPDSGLALADMIADGPLAKAGLQVDDVLTRFNDQLLTDPAQIIALVQSQHVGDTVRLSYVRHAQPGVAQVVVGTDTRSPNASSIAASGGGRSIAASGKVTVTMDHTEGAAATGAFKFKTVPSPRPSAALAAKLDTQGDVDPNSASVEAVHDGRLPDSEDQPDANFFFKTGNEPPRLKLDFGKAIPIKEVDTYSWHPSTRAPQVYRLWGLESADHPDDWKVIAEVDTRTQFGNAGGQYGVKIAAGDGIIGRYRFLVMDIAPTEKDDEFGNTFYSEIDVVNADAPTNESSVSTPPPHSTSQTTSYDREGVHLTFTDDSTGFDPKEKERLVDVFFTVYPRMEAEFNVDAPKIVRILMDVDYHGVAQAEGPLIRCNPAWFREHPEDLDVITHESMHVVQQYRQQEPTWITEGIADYARARFGVNNAAGDWTMPEYDAGQSYKDAYRVTARFFVWLEKHVKPGIVVALDRAMREEKYTPEFWTQQTGKSVDNLWQDYGKNPVL